MKAHLTISSRNFREHHYRELKLATLCLMPFISQERLMQIGKRNMVHVDTRLEAAPNYYQ